MRTWLRTVLVQLDALLNAICGGYANETISLRLALDASEGKRFACWFCRIIERWWPKHCDLSVPSKADRLTRPKGDGT